MRLTAHASIDPLAWGALRRYAAATVLVLLALGLRRLIAPVRSRRLRTIRNLAPRHG